MGLGVAMALAVNNGKRYSTVPIWVNDCDPDSCKTWKKMFLLITKRIRNILKKCQILEEDVRKLDIDNLVDIDSRMYDSPAMILVLLVRVKDLMDLLVPYIHMVLKYFEK